MALKKCPVCLTGPILRSDVKTCSPSCSQEWRSWSPQARAQAMERAIGNSSISLDELRESILKLNNPSESPTATKKPDEIPIDNPFLKEILK